MRASLALPPLERVGLAAAAQVSGEVAEQVSATAPVNPLVEVRLRVSVPVAAEDELAVTATMVLAGTSVKSESGLEMTLPLFSVTADG